MRSSTAHLTSGHPRRRQRSRPLTWYDRHGRAGPFRAVPFGRGRAQRQLRTWVYSQGLAQAGLLDKFDYLSTVSGGGYIGGWLSAWRQHTHERGEADPREQLARNIEPEPVTRLRRVIKFLDPRTGLLSADVWTLGGTMFRNLLVNWLVLIPLIAAAAMLPRIYLGLLGLPSQPELVSPATLNWWYLHDWIPIVVLIAIGTSYAAAQLPSLGHREAGSRSFVIGFLTPVLLVLFLLSVHRFWAWPFGEAESLSGPLLVSAAAMVGPWIVGGAFSKRWWRPWTWLAAAGCGTRRPTGGFMGASFPDRPGAARSAGVRRHRSADVAGAPFPADHGLHRAREPRHVRRRSRVVGARRGLDPDHRPVVARAQLRLPFSVRSRSMPDLPRSGSRSGSGRVGLSLIHARLGQRRLSADRSAGIAGQEVAARDRDGVVAGRAADNDLACRARLGRQPSASHVRSRPAALPRDAAPGRRVAARGSARSSSACFALGAGLGRVISINQFSLHGMYRSRLVRTFLGVSRSTTERHPSAFTGFDAGGRYAVRPGPGRRPSSARRQHDAEPRRRQCVSLSPNARRRRSR